MRFQCQLIFSPDDKQSKQLPSPATCLTMRPFPEQRRRMARRRRKSPSRIVLLLLLVGVSYGSYYLGETGTLDDVVAEQVAVPVTKLRRNIEDLWTDLRQVLPDEWLGDWAGERPGAP